VVIRVLGVERDSDSVGAVVEGDQVEHVVSLRRSLIGTDVCLFMNDVEGVLVVGVDIEASVIFVRVDSPFGF